MITLRTTSDGWRAVLADEFTFANVRAVSVAMAKRLCKEKAGERGILIGYDTRFMGAKFAATVADSVHELGIPGHVAISPVPTPVLSYNVFHRKSAAGIMVTASHNPAHFNGLKLRMDYGGPPDETVMQEIEEGFTPAQQLPIAPSYSSSNTFDPRPAYEDAVMRLVNVDAISRAKIRIAVDSMHGATGGYADHLVGPAGVAVIPVRNTTDPTFGGVTPEPGRGTVALLTRAVMRHQCALGYAHDGDGDRIVAVDPVAGYLSPHDILLLLAWYLGGICKWPGSIVGSVAASHRVRRLAEYLNRPYSEQPIGFRNISAKMRSEAVLVAGEENGGIGIGRHLPERDGTLAGLLLAEMIATTGRPLHAHLALIADIVGTSELGRKDIACPVNGSRIVDAVAASPPDHFAGRSIRVITSVGGLKMWCDDNSWGLLRAGGTESVLRLYAEAPTHKQSQTILAELEEFVRRKAAAISLSTSW